MRLITSPEQFNVDDLFVDLEKLTGHRLYLKCEGLNLAGSVKLKTAIGMVDDAELAGALVPGSVLVESSSGNLGMALSLLARSRGYSFVCVTDSRCTLGASQMMRALGATVHVVTDPDPETGLLGARIRKVKDLCARNANHYWLNQYANPANWRAHYRTTGPEILDGFPDVAAVFIGAGSTGTLMGCARYLREHRPDARIVAVDSVGSVTFGDTARPRSIPGLGTAIRPPMLDTSYIDEVVHVAEVETVRACRHLVRGGYLFGGSTGTVVSGATEWLARNGAYRDATCVAIAPDMGERYLDTVYADQWATDVYGLEALAPGLSSSATQYV